MEQKESTPSMREVINLENTYALSQRIKSNYSQFNDSEFNSRLKESLSELNLMDRILLVQNTLEEFLPKDFKKTVDILLKSQLPELVNDRSDNYPSDFIAVPLSGLIAKVGCTKEFFDLSMEAQYDMTKRFSCEWSIHDFIENFEDECFEYFKKWVLDDNCHVRRLCSEGIRPKLPWSRPFKKFQKDPTRLFEILELLYYDENRYVVRSLCNCLNDISKTHPKLVVDHLMRWEKTNKQKQSEFNWMKKHALRTLIKQGDTYALEYLGFKNNVELECNIEIKKDIVHLNESLEFEVKVDVKTKSKILLDYLIYFVKANGKQSPKVFKLKALDLDGSITLTKKHSFKKMTTRKLYEGIHKVAIQINGKQYAEKEFNFKE
jgi:3-methyladenine DNA glycosylase AlkC